MDLIGRDVDLEHLGQLLDGHRLVTVVGSGGIGKTALCRHFAAGADGTRDVAWIDLTTASRDGDALLAMARSAGAADGAPTDFERVAHAVASRGNVLLVIDNCEHVLAEIASIIEHILERCPAAQVVATSRTSLEIAGEVTWRLCPLALPPASTSVSPNDLVRYGATALFVERLHHVLPELHIGTSEAQHIATICTMLDGIPLAVMLAAGQARSLPLDRLSESLRRSNTLLTTSRSGTRQRAYDVDASIRWSYDLLDGGSAAVLHALAAMPEHFGLDLAVQVVADVAPDPDVALAAITRLVGRGLVEYDAGAGTHRLTFIVRHFVDALADPDGVLDASRRRHALATIEWATAQTRWGQRKHPGALDARAVDVHRAIGWAMEHDPELACAAFADFGVLLHGALHAAYCEWLVERTDRGITWARAVAMLPLLAPPSAFARVVEVLPEAVSIANAANDQHALRLLRCPHAHLAAMQGDIAPARQLAAEAKEADDGWIVVATATTASLVASWFGLGDEATALAAETRWACQQGGLDYYSTAAPLADAWTLHVRGEIDAANDVLGSMNGNWLIRLSAGYVSVMMAIDRGDAHAAHAVIDSVGTGDDPAEQALVTHASVALDVIDGNWAAVAHGVESPLGREVAMVLDLRLLRAGALANLADQAHATAALGDVEQILAALAHPAPLPQARALLLRARAEAQAGDLDAALRAAAQAATIAGEHRFRLVQIDALDVLASLAVARGDKRLVGRLIAASAAARASIGYASRVIAGPIESATDPIHPAESDVPALSVDDAVRLALRGRGARRRPAFGVSSLTPTEHLVATLVAAGRTNAQIGDELLMSTATVKTHLTRAFAKVGVINRTQLALMLGRPD